MMGVYQADGGFVLCDARSSIMWRRRMRSVRRSTPAKTSRDGMRPRRAFREDGIRDVTVRIGSS